MSEYMKAGKFKARCLKVMDRVKKTKRRVIITKRNVPVAQMVPVDEKSEELYGKMKGTVHYKDDITKPTGEEWDADR
ncbi:MAG: type II toxin-antitoxin system Phd/YefM family antitoxin [Verrucomicrobia bacterium]|nr:type II toxin-antitoxin system Phd/YefM family antitoxin [Verrucomicrobiota bacterium]